MGADLLILILSDLTNLVLGISIFLRSPHAVVNRIFAAMSFSIIAWTTLNFAADQSDSATAALWLSRATLIGGVGILLSILMLSQRLPRKRQAGLYADRFIVYLSALIVLLVLTPYVVTAVNPTPSGADLLIGPLYGAYLGYLLVGSIVIIRNFLWQIRNVTSHAERNQITILVSGLILYAAFTMVFNVILPVIIDSWSSSRFGPVFSLFIVGLTAYAIVKHKLFDIRPVLARAVGYVLSTLVLAAAYGFLVLGTAHLLFGVNLSIQTQIFLALTTGLAGLLFQHFRKTFDNLTRKIFFQDAYEPQELFDHLNKVLVSTVDLNALLLHSSRSIRDSLHVEFCAVAVKEQGSSPVRIIGTEKLQFDPKEVAMVRKSTPQMHTSVIAADYLDEKHANLKAVLVKNKIAVLVRLSSNVKANEEGLGYIVLGAKKSGNSYTGQDFQVLDTVANELIIAIQNSLRYEEIENFAATMQAKVEEATRKLRRTNEKLRELDEAKDDFVSMASHQLRTPLTSIKGYTSMVLEGDAGKINATQRKLLEQSFFSSQRMVYLIADLLNVSRLKTGKFIIESAPVNIAEVVEQEIGQLKDVAHGRSLELAYERPENFPTLMLDETKTRQVIMNFVDNAIYYTPAGGHIKVELIETPSSVEFKVTDDGIGVPKSEQPHLFTKFYRANNARKARPDGTGLGLFMAKKVIIAEGGAIIFETEEGKGSTFGFVFSKDKAATPVKQP